MSEFAKELQKKSSSALWQDYCEQKETIEQLEQQNEALMAQVEEICSLAFECCGYDSLKDLEQGIAKIKHKYEDK